MMHRTPCCRAHGTSALASRLPTHHLPTTSLVATALFTLFAGCGNRPAVTGGGGVATVVPRDWGPLPTSYRGPGPLGPSPTGRT